MHLCKRMCGLLKGMQHPIALFTKGSVSEGQKQAASQCYWSIANIWSGGSAVKLIMILSRYSQIRTLTHTWIRPMRTPVTGWCLSDMLSHTHNRILSPISTMGVSTSLLSRYDNIMIVFDKKSPLKYLLSCYPVVSGIFFNLIYYSEGCYPTL